MPERRAPEPVSLALLAGAFGAYSLAHLASETLLARPAAARALAELSVASGGWVEPGLVRALVVLAVFLLVVVGLGGRGPRVFGWRARHVVPGVLVTLGAWAALELGLAAAVLVRHGAIALDPAWSGRGAAPALAPALVALLAHALVEDTAFRGFFLPQLRRRLARPGVVALLAAGGALAGSAVLLGLAHLPASVLVVRADMVVLAREQADLLAAGLALGLVALATRNLFAVVGLHVLLVAPATLVEAPAAWARRGALLALGTVVVLAAMRRLRRGSTEERGGARELRRAA